MAATAQDSGRAAPIAPFLIKFMGFMTMLFVVFHLVHVHHHSQHIVVRGPTTPPPSAMLLMLLTLSPTLSLDNHQCF